MVPRRLRGLCDAGLPGVSWLCALLCPKRVPSTVVRLGVDEESVALPVSKTCRSCVSSGSRRLMICPRLFCCCFCCRRRAVALAAAGPGWLASPIRTPVVLSWHVSCDGVVARVMYLGLKSACVPQNFALTKGQCEPATTMWGCLWLSPGSKTQKRPWLPMLHTMALFFIFFM